MRVGDCVQSGKGEKNLIRVEHFIGDDMEDITRKWGCDIITTWNCFGDHFPA